MTETKTGKQIIKNSLFGFTSWFLPLGLSFAATPIIVSVLGNTDYGIYSLVLGFIGSSFSLNIGRAITKYIAEYRATGETEKIREVISTTFFLNITVGLVGVGTAVMLAGWMAGYVFRLEGTALNKTVEALYIASAIIFFAMLGQIFSAVLQGLHRFDVYSKIINLNSFLLLTGNLGLALYGFGLITLLCWNLLITILSGLVFYFSAKNLLPEMKISLKFDLQILKMVFRYSASLIIYQLLANFLLQFERGWLLRQFGAEDLTFYIVPMTLGVYIHSFIISLTMVIFPLASELSNDRTRLLDLYRKVTKTVSVLVVFLMGTLILQNRNFLQLWMGETFAERSADLLIIHTVTFGLLSISIVAWQMTDGLGYPQLNLYIFLICLVITGFLMIYLTGEYGMPGVGIGRLVGFSTMFFAVFYVEKFFFKEVQKVFWLKLGSTLGLAIVPALLIEYMLAEILEVSWLSLIVSVLAGGVIYFLSLWGLGILNKEEKIFLKRILTRQS